VRIVICGGPKTGKTTLSQNLGCLFPVHHADDFISLGWSEASNAVAGLFSNPDPWVVEGVSCARALRKWLKSHPEGRPCDKVILLMDIKSMDGYTTRHSSMASGVHTVFAEIEGELMSRGVEVVRR
jgi:dephospho-CoA kinase